jgi:hypothetical protein
MVIHPPRIMLPQTKQPVPEPRISGLLGRLRSRGSAGKGGFSAALSHRPNREPLLIEHQTCKYEINFSLIE